MANLIPIFITLLVCGALFVFFNARLAAVQSAVEKQNRVLTAFITNVQNDIRGGAPPPPFCDGTTGSYQLSGAGVCARPGANGVGANGVGANGVGANGVGANHLASAQAVNAAARQFDNGKIVVSEDESDDDSDESDSSDSSDSSDESDDDVDVNDEVEVINVVDVEVVDVVNVVNVVNGIEVVDDGIEVVEIENNSVKLQEESTKVEEIIPLSFDTLPTLSDNNNETLKVVHLDSSDSVVVDYEHMKVDELRKLVSDKGLATKEEVKKLKKPELLVLLKN